MADEESIFVPTEYRGTESRVTPSILTKADQQMLKVEVSSLVYAWVDGLVLDKLAAFRCACVDGSRIGCEPPLDTD